MLMITPTVSASWFTKEVETEFSFDEEIIKNVSPVFIGNTTPEIVYARNGKIGDSIVIQYFFYWEKQNTSYYLNHDDDYETLAIYCTHDLRVYKLAYDKWHYIIGREEKPHNYGVVEAVNETNVSGFYPDNVVLNNNMTLIGNTTRICISFVSDYHAPIIENDAVLNNETVATGLAYLDDIVEMTDEVIVDAEESVGFNGDLYRYPEKFWDKGWWGFYNYKNMWANWFRGVIINFDYNTEWVDFSVDKTSTDVVSHTVGRK